MQGYVARKGDRYYAVIYEGIDPLTGRDRRRWYPACAHANSGGGQRGGTRPENGRWIGCASIEEADRITAGLCGAAIRRCGTCTPSFDQA